MNRLLCILYCRLSFWKFLSLLHVFGLFFPFNQIHANFVEWTKTAVQWSFCTNVKLLQTAAKRHRQDFFFGSLMQFLNSLRGKFFVGVLGVQGAQLFFPQRIFRPKAKLVSELKYQDWKLYKKGQAESCRTLATFTIATHPCPSHIISWATAGWQLGSILLCQWCFLRGKKNTNDVERNPVTPHSPGHKVAAGTDRVEP